MLVSQTKFNRMLQAITRHEQIYKGTILDSYRSETHQYDVLKDVFTKIPDVIEYCDYDTGEILHFWTIDSGVETYYTENKKG